MTTASLYATSLVAGAVTTDSAVLGAPNATWTTDVDNTSWDARFAIDNIPTGQELSGTQTIDVFCRKETGTGNPTFTVELWENGAFVSTLASGVSVTSTTGVNVGGTFAAGAITNPDNVQIRLVSTASGGGPSARSTVQVDAITWTATYVTAAANLVVADSAHAHAAEAPVLTQVHDLAGLGEADHAHDAEAVTITTAPIQLLTATFDASEVTAGADVEIRVVATAVSSTTAQIESIEWQAVALESGVADLVVAGADHGHTTENVDLAQAHALAVSDAQQDHSVEAPVLAQVHELVAADGSHDHTAEPVALTLVHSLVVADSGHGHVVDGFLTGTLPTLLVNGNGDGTTYQPRNWATQSYLDIDEGIAAADGAEITGPAMTTGSSGIPATSFLLQDMPVDFAGMTTLNVRARLRSVNRVDDSMSLLVRILDVDGNQLAGNTYQVVEGSPISGTVHNTAVVAFTYVNTSGSKAQWDGAILELTQSWVSGGTPDSAYLAIDSIELTGTYKSTASLTLVLNSNLVVADSAHAHSVDTVTLTQIYELVVADGAHAHAIDSIALTQVHAIAVADADHGHLVESTTLALDTINLVPADIFHDHAVDPVLLTQVHQLGVVDVAHAHGIEAVVLTQEHELPVDDIALLHTVEAITLVQQHSIVLVDADHEHAVEAVVLAQIHDLVAVDSAHDHAVEAPGLTQLHSLAGLADLAHDHSVESVTITVDTINLVVTDAFHGHAADAPVLVQQHVLTVDDSTDEHAAESLVLVQAHQLVGVADAEQDHTVETVVLTQDHALAVSDAALEHTVDAITVTQVHGLAVDDSTHGHSAENTVVTQDHFLVASAADHAHTVDAFTLTAEGTLAVQDAAHGHAAETTLATLVETATLYADAHLTGTVATAANALGVSDNTWTTNTTAWDSRFSMENPPAGAVLDGVQPVMVQARQTAAGTGTPTITVELWENGVFVKTVILTEDVTT